MSMSSLKNNTVGNYNVRGLETVNIAPESRFSVVK